MKKLLWLFALLVLFACGSKPIPDWTNEAFNQLAQYKKDALLGKGPVAELHFNKAVEEIKKTGNLEILAKVYLTKCAIQMAVLERIDDREYLRTDAVQSVAQNRSFHSFLKGDLNHVEENMLPAQYRRLFTTYRDRKLSGLQDEIVNMEDPVSKLIATGFLVQNNACDEECLKIAIDTASRNGWKKALIVYLEKLQFYYDQRNDKEKATAIKNKLDLITH